MLTKSLKISDTSKKEFLDLIFFKSDQKIRQKNCRVGLSSVLDPLKCWLSINVLTRRLFGHLSNSAFSSQQFQKEITSEAQLFFKKYGKF